MNHSLRVSVIFLSVLTISAGLSSGGRSAGSGGRASKYDSQKSYGYGTGGGYYGNVQKEINKTTAKPPETSRGLGISAWGIVGIVISVILFSAGTYYFIIFYPLVCKKERKYDVIELSPVKI